MVTSSKSTGQWWNDLPLFAEGIPASLSAKQVIAKVKKILATCGLGYDKPLANYDPATQSLRMSEGIFPLGEQPSLPILPPSGMTRNGALFQQPAWVLITDATGLSLLPTPTASEHKYRLRGDSQQSHCLEAMARRGELTMWPTPRSSSAMNEDMETLKERLDNGTPYKSRLEEAVAMWPTPRAALGDTRNHTVYERSLDKPQNLENRVGAADPSTIGGKLNPTWVEWLMGFPTGWTDLED